MLIIEYEAHLKVRYIYSNYLIFHLLLSLFLIINSVLHLEFKIAIYFDFKYFISSLFQIFILILNFLFFFKKLETFVKHYFMVSHFQIQYSLPLINSD